MDEARSSSSNNQNQQYLFGSFACGGSAIYLYWMFGKTNQAKH
jgi:hypothetical protein